jgi:hypothetical protein
MNEEEKQKSLARRLADRAINASWDNVAQYIFVALIGGAIWQGLAALQRYVPAPDFGKYTLPQVAVVAGSVFFGFCVGVVSSARHFKQRQIALDKSFQATLNIEDPGSAVGKLSARAGEQLKEGAELLTSLGTTISAGRNIVTTAGTTFGEFE